VGCDIEIDSAGVCIFDNVITAPRASDANYIDFISSVFERYSIDLFIPTSEAEIAVISEFGVTDGRLLGIKTIIADKDTITKSLDKYKTFNFLKANNIPAPWTLLSSTLPTEYPCIYKQRSGQGSKGLYIVNSKCEADILKDKTNYIWQELLGTEKEEYTCGLFRSKSGELRSIVIQRTLQNGFTVKGQVVNNSDIDSYIMGIANKLKFIGSVNFQLRMTNNGPVLFEINPRFSSTVMFRHKLGFKDLVWCIQDLYDTQIEDYQAPKTGTRIFRGIEEYIKE
jgi:carbamoyl-phosphate synthase large subunit